MALWKKRSIFYERCFRNLSKNTFLESPSFISPSFIYPPISFFSEVRKSSLVLIDLFENYQKRSYRNRFEILTSNGKQSLSIPLKKGKNEKQLISEVLISYDSNWPNQHLQTIQSAYGKSPYFEHYFPIIESLFQKRIEKLSELNDAALQQSLKSLKIDGKFDFTSSYNPDKTVTSYAVKKYPQVFEYKYGFTENLSIIDLLFNTGPEAVLYL